MTPITVDPIFINFLLGIISIGLAFGLKVNHDSIKKLEDRINNLHDVYAKREDVTNAIETIRRMVQRIEDKLDHKVDR